MMKKSVRNIIIGSGVAVGTLAIVGVGSHIVSQKLMDVALDRDVKIKQSAEPNRAKKLAGVKYNEDFLAAVAESKERLEKLELETVHIEGYDGEHLTGHWFGSKDAKRTVIAMHGWRSSWAKDFGMISDFLHREGCNVLYAEQRGQNESGGKHMGMGMLERYDCLEWIKWVNEKNGENMPIYLAGISMGATTVLMATGLTLPSNVRGVIADSGFTSADAIFKHITEDNLHISYNIRKNTVNGICEKKINMKADAYSALDAMKACKVPVLFIHGSSDGFVPVDMTYENYNACSAARKLLIVPGADHGMSYYLARNEYEGAVLEMWNKYDCL